MTFKVLDIIMNIIMTEDITEEVIAEETTIIIEVSILIIIKIIF